MRKKVISLHAHCCEIIFSGICSMQAPHTGMPPIATKASGQYVVTASCEYRIANLDS